MACGGGIESESKREREREREKREKKTDRQEPFWLKSLWAIHGGLGQDGITSGSSSWVLEASTPCGEVLLRRVLLDGHETGSTEEIASWSVEAERIAREVEEKKRKLQGAIEKESTLKDVRMADECLDGLDGSLSS